MDVLASIQNKEEEEEIFYGSDQSNGDHEIKDENQHRYNRLLDAVISIDGKKRRIAPQRSEPRAEASEYTIHNNNHDKISLHELASSLGNTNAHNKLKKEIYKAQKRQKVLPPPLPKQHAEKIKRTLIYDKTKEDITKWDSVVQHNRLAPQIVYPLNQADIRLKTGPELARQFKAMTPLEQEIAALLNGSKNVLKDDRLLTPAEEEAFKSMSLEEALEKRKELQKMRALQSHMEAKARRQNKIKSKRYHRLLKKERLKAYIKEFEQLREKNPEAAIKKLDEINKQRIIERMTLRHRGTGKWAKHVALRAKYDLESRRVLAEQLLLNRELTQKKMASKEDSEEEEEESRTENESKKVVIDPFNPWVNNKSGKDGDEDAGNASVSYQKEWAKSRQDITELKERKKKINEQKKPEHKDRCIEKKTKKLQNLELKKKMKQIKTKIKGSAEKKLTKQAQATQNEQKEELHPLENPLNTEDSFLVETNVHSGVEKNDLVIQKTSKEDLISSDVTRMENRKQTNKNVSETEVQIDPKKFVIVETRTLKSAMPNIITAGEDEDDADHLMTISEAFADDDVIHSFREEKNSIIDRDKPKDINTYLPGWGSWGGSGIKESRRKKQRFVIKAPPAPPRKDSHLGNIIISENKDEGISKHQVNELPFPFTDVASFESSIRAPVGKLWNAETAHRNLVEPKIVTARGTIIEPIDSDILVNKKMPRRRTNMLRRQTKI